VIRTRSSSVSGMAVQGGLTAGPSGGAPDWRTGGQCR
jgi:hypothetical protein